MNAKLLHFPPPCLIIQGLLQCWQTVPSSTSTILHLSHVYNTYQNYFSLIPQPSCRSLLVHTAISAVPTKNFPPYLIYSASSYCVKAPVSRRVLKDWHCFSHLLLSRSMRRDKKLKITNYLLHRPRTSLVYCRWKCFWWICLQSRWGTIHSTTLPHILNILSLLPYHKKNIKLSLDR